ncbi:LacI family DNA-binding transcriptional regulator [Neiella marina]|uniref:LacI family DNA-binding transcriptional regulator n=1 Tax=Neiella holothuriorum TaxID=2870530 RepID=A0ABS7ELB4_9GAMM|nr:LacI family DNA-binding transcriptional regulator [Neiella holothuriorum]MBW8192472.1 LacI family DNA-binding transcriptional regulator [Neiella holothuriorum]
MAKITLKTIADALDFAVTTVSRALKDDPAIKLQTRRVIQAKARELGYVPDRAGVRLRTGKTNVISLVLPVEPNMSNVVTRLTVSVAEVLKGTSYNLNTSYWFEGDDPLGVIKQIVETRAADGLILNYTTPDDRRVDYLKKQNFPFVTHGRTSQTDNHPYFDFDNETFACLSVNKLKLRGRRKIMLILPPPELSYTGHLQRGLLLGQQQTGVALVACPTIHSDSPSADIEAEVTAMLSTMPDIDAIIASSSTAAMVTVAVLEAQGRTLGSDIDVLGREAAPFLKLLRKNLLLANEDVGKAGNFLARALIHAIEQPNEAPMQGMDIPTIEQIN